MSQEKIENLGLNILMDTICPKNLGDTHLMFPRFFALLWMTLLNIVS